MYKSNLERRNLRRIDEANVGTEGESQSHGIRLGRFATNLDGPHTRGRRMSAGKYEESVQPSDLRRIRQEDGRTPLLAREIREGKADKYDISPVQL